MPVELFLSPFMRPVVKLRSAIMDNHRDDSHYTPIIVDLAPTAKPYIIRKEFGTGSKMFSVFDKEQQGPKTYNDKLYYMVRSRAVKGAYKLYIANDELPIATLRAGLRSNFMYIKSHDQSELDLGWHTVDHRVDALDRYRMFKLSDGYTYQWTIRGQFLERVENVGQKESEIRKRVAHVRVLADKAGFDIEIDESIINRELAIATAMICYVEAWNTLRGYGGIYLAELPGPRLSFKRD